MIGIELVKDWATKEPISFETLQDYERTLDQSVIFGASKFGGLSNVVKIKPSLAIN